MATWQSAARFAAEVGECTVFLKSDGEGKAELLDRVRRGAGRLQEAVRALRPRPPRPPGHARAASPGSVSTAARDDGTAFTAEQVEQVIRRGRPDILCPVCEKRVSLRDDYELANGTDQSTAAMDASADAGREIAAASAVLRGKEEVAEFDVFLCHN